MKKIAATFLALALAGSVIAGCSPADERAGRGALIGAAGAAAVTAIISGDAQDTLRAAAIGAAAGAIIGYATADRRECWYADGRGGYYKGRCR
ncbi:MAG TPA: hypothetical protein PKE65_04770 [Rhizobiaceae bacterium]|nr:hypothetical protein [Rhizobiaceae bacterium]